MDDFGDEEADMMPMGGFGRGRIMNKGFGRAAAAMTPMGAPRPNAYHENSAPIQDSAVEPPVQNSDSLDSENTSEEEFNSELDFMLNIPANTRTYSHQLRENYEHHWTRVDFTQTILFESSQNLTYSN
jgi:hypothetical protein